MTRSLRVLAAMLTVLVACSAGAAAAMARGDAEVVHYRGYRIAVPAAWPVYDLARDPTICVRFNRHAVYLGEPGAEERCPAHAVGRTEAILVAPMVARGARAGGAGGRALPRVTDARAQPARGSVAELAIRARHLVVTATWARHPEIVDRALGIHASGSGRIRAAASVREPVARARAASGGGIGGSVYTGLGFDPCSTPSASQMSAWGSSPYRAVGVYVGGANMACSQSNLTAGWASQEAAAGWHLILIYVGLQAPANSCGCAAIDPGRASAEGSAAATDAVNQARSIGVGTGNAIYFDMEAYSRGGGSTSAVLAFLSAWTSQLHADGYTSGVYSSAASGISDLVAVHGTSYTEPDDIWIADWNGQQTTSDPYVPSGDWASHQRLHQYDGGHDATYGGVTINIDGDYLDGATAGTGGGFADGTFVRVASTAATYRLAGGAPLYVSDWSYVGGPHSYVVINQQQLDSLRSVPADGVFIETNVGAVYRIAGGSPMYVSDWSRFHGVRPTVAVDQWNIDNISNPAAHLGAVPASGTFLTTTTGQVYRVAGGAPLAVSDWGVFGGVKPSVTVDQWDIDNIANPAAHLSPKPADGTIVEGLPSRTYWALAAGDRTPTSVNPAAVQVDDTALAAFPALPPPRPIINCVVPTLGHLTLGQARRALRAAHCRLGLVHRPRHPPRHRALRVTTQSTPASTTQVVNYPVDVTLG